MRERLRAQLSRGREMLWEAGWSDRMRLLALGLYDDEEEALEGLEPAPGPVSDADLDETIALLPDTARHVRAFCAKHGDLWSAADRAAALAYADELEDRYRRYREEDA